MLAKDHLSLDKKKSELILNLISISPNHKYIKKLMVFVGDQNKYY
jgi:hypothetical protein